MNGLRTYKRRLRDYSLLTIILTWAILSFSSPLPVYAHFGMVIPSANMVAPDSRKVSLSLSFSHPFEMIGMDLAKPKAFFMVTQQDGEVKNGSQSRDDKAQHDRRQGF